MKLCGVPVLTPCFVTLRNIWFLFRLQSWHDCCLVTCLLLLFIWWIKSFVPARIFSGLRF